MSRNVAEATSHTCHVSGTIKSAFQDASVAHWARIISAALIASALISIGDGRARAEDAATDIHGALERWRLDFNARRSANICGLFADDLRYDFRGLPEQNYSLLCDRLHLALSDTTRSFHYDLRIKEIVISGSLAIVRLTWISTLTTNGNSDTHEEPGLDVFQKQADGRWQIIRYIAYEAE
jgi:ketosteroid isomerase-like protein